MTPKKKKKKYVWVIVAPVDEEGQDLAWVKLLAFKTLHRAEKWMEKFGLGIIYRVGVL